MSSSAHGLLGRTVQCYAGVDGQLPEHGPVSVDHHLRQWGDRPYAAVQAQAAAARRQAYRVAGNLSATVNFSSGPLVKEVRPSRIVSSHVSTLKGASPNCAYVRMLPTGFDMCRLLIESSPPVGATRRSLFSA